MKPKHQHPSISHYQMGCRCDGCKVAKRLNHKERQKKRISAGEVISKLVLVEYEHGTTSRYMKGCRCIPCKEAKSIYNKEQIRKRRERERILQLNGKEANKSATALS